MLTESRELKITRKNGNNRAIRDKNNTECQKLRNTETPTATNLLREVLQRRQKKKLFLIETSLFILVLWSEASENSFQRLRSQKCNLFRIMVTFNNMKLAVSLE
jgi:hypothetical protein